MPHRHLRRPWPWPWPSLSPRLTCCQRPSTRWHGLALALAALAVLITATPASAERSATSAQVTRATLSDPTLAACQANFETVLQATPAAAPPSEAQAVWLSRRFIRWPDAAPTGRFRLLHSALGQMTTAPGQVAQGFDGAITLITHTAALPARLQQRFKWVTGGATLALRPQDQAQLPNWLRGQLVLVQEDEQGRVLGASALQQAGLLDDLFAAAEGLSDLGARPSPQGTGFKLWAPTAQRVWLCVHRPATEQASRLLPLRRDHSTGAWSTRAAGDLSGHTYTYLVDVFVRGVGWVRNRVTDPYALSLNADSRRTWIGRLDAPALTPPGWYQQAAPKRVQSATDLVIYELHVRDFSISDASVSPAHRGKYLAFTEANSRGMQHLQALSKAGLTDVHLLPVFDLASVPERGCTSPDPGTLAQAGADSEAQQAAVAAQARSDCYNWGYDPLHFTAPEGSFASDAEDGATRVLEFRRMVQVLHAAGLRVGMDVVYNHTSASGQKAQSVLDRIVPGYYQRLNAKGAVETSTCCDNTATENRMMAKLMIDSAVVWARDYRIDSFRFDLMGHQPRQAMERLQTAVNRASGRHIHLLGEGWNFGEIADGARFLQASQLSLNGTGIGAFSDRGRDAARGGGCCDNAVQTQERQGWLNGLFYDPNPHARASAADLLRAADMVRIGLAGTLRSYAMTTADGSRKRLADIDYAGQGAGFASQPSEVVNYVENHDNQTLFDINVLKLPVATSREDRARVQVLGLALTTFSQGMAYFHAGVELLRSKSGDRNSFDSGDWFNRLDWTATDNHWGSGLPPQESNADFWSALRPLLANPAIKPTPADIAFTRDAFLDLLRIRQSSLLFRLRRADEVSARLSFPNTGPEQQATVVVGHLDGRGLPGAGFAEVLYAVNADKVPVTLALPQYRGRAFVLHPAHSAPQAADRRPSQLARWDAQTGQLLVPARTALVYVLE